ncbi:hypothetical protein [Streptomyces goshikiensis]
MPLPTTRVVTGHYVSPATGANATGRIVLAPYPGVWTDETGDQVLAGGATLTLVDGAFSQALVTTDASGVEPATGRLWIAEERITGLPYRRRVFELPTGVGSIDITDLVIADPAGAGYVRGPTGPVGPQGPEGPAGATGPPGADGSEAVAEAYTDAAIAAEVTRANAAYETPAGAQAKATAAQSAATSTAASALAAHEADSTSVHGIADTSALETTTGAAAKVSTHAGATDPHGDRAWATGQFYPLASGTALDGYLGDALNRITALETRMTAAEAEVRAAVKTADESVTGSTTLQDDDHLALSVVAGGWYAIEAHLDVEADPAADITIGWSAPASAVLSWTETGISAGNTGNIGSIKQSRLDVATSSGVGIVAAGSTVRPAGVLRVAATAGTLQLRWAQTVSSGTPTTLKTGSWLRLTRIA